LRQGKGAIASMIVHHFLKWVETAKVSERAAGAGALARAYVFSELDFEERCAAEATWCSTSGPSALTAGFRSAAGSPRSIRAGVEFVPMADVWRGAEQFRRVLHVRRGEQLPHGSLLDVQRPIGSSSVPASDFDRMHGVAVGAIGPAVASPRA
jgi:hypothetical protein